MVNRGFNRDSVTGALPDLYGLAIFGMYILAEALQNIFSAHSASTLKFKHRLL